MTDSIRTRLNREYIQYVMGAEKPIGVALNLKDYLALVESLREVQREAGISEFCQKSEVTYMGLPIHLQVADGPPVFIFDGANKSLVHRINQWLEAEAKKPAA